MEAFSKSRIDGVTEAQECWNAFFSSLAFAEQAAGEQCRAIATDLQKQGDPSLAALYTELAAEEDRHFALVKRVCQKLEEPSGTARRVYSGEWMSEAPSTIERMACVHLVFEPAALAFLGYLHAHSEEVIIDPIWSKTIRESFSNILRDEVEHVYLGKEWIRAALVSATPEDIRKTRKSIRRHRAFLIAGLKSYFKHMSKEPKCVAIMLSRFNFYFEKSMQGVFV